MANNNTAPLVTVYATDEDVCVRASADFATLVPHDQILAAGVDGVFSSGSRWVLTSSVPFLTQGVTVGNIIRLTGPTATWKGIGAKYAVSAVADGSLTLRNVGQVDGIGQPPGPAAGVTGVSFVIATFGPQLEDSSYQLNGQFGLDPNFALITPTLIYDLRVLKQVTVLTVLVRALTTGARTKTGDFPEKLARYQSELSDAMGRMVIRWNTLNDNPPPVTRFATRVGR